MKKQKILILGASILQLPAIKKAKENNYHTIVVDYNPNAIGFKFADESYVVSTTDVDAVVQLAQKIKPDGVMTLATDMPMRTVAAVASSLGLPGITMETAIKATDKGEMIKAFADNNVEHPWFYIIKNTNDLLDVLPLLTYPCVIKPTDNAGNRGVSYVECEKEILELYIYSYNNSRSGTVIIEEYMEGQEVSVELIVKDNIVNILSVTDKLTLGKPFFVEVGHSEPSMLNDDAVKKIKDLATRAVLAVGINNSPAHVEIMLTDDGPKMVELGARMGGGCITTHLVPLSVGIDMLQCVMDISMGKDVSLIPKFLKGSALRHISGVEGKIVAINGIEKALKLEGVKEITMLKNIGDELTYFKNGSDRVGYVIAQADSASDAIEICNKALSLIEIKVE